MVATQQVATDQQHTPTLNSNQAGPSKSPQTSHSEPPKPKSRPSGMTRMGDALEGMPPGLLRRLDENEARRLAGGRWNEYIPGKGCIWHGPLTQDEQLAAEERRSAQVRGILRASGVPSNFFEANFETNSRGEVLQVTPRSDPWAYGTERAHLACRSLSQKWTPGYAGKGGYNGIVLQSPGFGTGKTYLLSALLVQLVQRGQRVGFVKCEDLLSRYRSTFGNQGGAGQSAEQIYEEYAKVPLLVLDELGGDYIKSGEAGEWARAQFLRLLDRRLDQRLTTLGTTNVTREDLEAHYGGRMVSRLLSKSLLIPMDGPDFRQLDRDGGRFSDAEDPFSD